METYLLDKTFLSAGSIGTGVWVRNGKGSPSSLSDIENRVSVLAGTNSLGSILPIGVSVVGCSASGKEVIIRIAGIAKVKNQVTYGSIMQGKLAWPCSGGKTKISSYIPGTVRKAIGGIVVHAEGKGSPNSLISVLVSPQFI